MIRGFCYPTVLLFLLNKKPNDLVLFMHVCNPEEFDLIRAYLLDCTCDITTAI